MLLQAVVQLAAGKIAFRNTSCYCDSCFSSNETDRKNSSKLDVQVEKNQMFNVLMLMMYRWTEIFSTFWDAFEAGN